MSIEYALKIVSSTPPGRIAELVRGAEEANLERLPRGLAVGLPGVHCAVVPVDDIDAEIAEETYGLHPNVAVVFRIDKSRRTEGLRMMQAALMRILIVEPGDAILLANLEHPALRRRDGRGVLIDRFGPWPKEMLSALGPAWTVGPELPAQT